MLHDLPVIVRFREELFNFASNPVFFISLFVLIPFSLISSFIVLILVFRKLNSLEEKSKKMREIASYIQHGAKVYLKDQAQMLSIILAILFVPVGLTGIEFLDNPFVGFLITGLIFLLGSLSSLLAGYIGMRAATKANILVIEASIDDPNESFRLAYFGGMITGILNISLFVLGIWLILILTSGNIYLMTGFSFGASVSSLLSQVGGGIYTKSADMGADLVGKYEHNIKEDDPRNPAIIADLVGDNVGDCAGRGADLFESASSDAVGGMLLGLTIFILVGDPIFIISDLTLISLGMFSLFFTTAFLKIDFNNSSKSIWKVFISATLFNGVLMFFISILFFGIYGILLFFAGLIGLIAVFITIIITTYYTSIEHKPTMKVAKASLDSPSVNIISGLSTGLSSVFFPILIFSISIVGSYLLGYYFGEIYFFKLLNSPDENILGRSISPTIFLIAFGIWGVNMASVASDSIISTILSFDTFGPICDNAAGIVQMGGEEDNMPTELRSNLDRLDAVGNTTKAVAKGFALICGGFSSIVMFLTFLLSAHAFAGELPSRIPTDQLINIFDYLDLFNPLIILGIFTGVIIPVIFTAMILKAVQRGAEDMITEVRRQFDEIPGLKEGNNTSKPDYDRCIDISAHNALRYMLKPVLSVIFIVIIMGILFGPMVVAGLLIGNLIGCLVFGLFMSISGAVFDNAKKGIEDGLFGGKGSFAHKSAIIGDTVGDPLKDSAGPAMNIIITTINTLALTFLPLFIMTAFIWGIFPL
ncbi:MAG: sodium-translocating pyrophosphatase [Candidatus Lokiarchaeota archaeon]|nr:sodium-translocating pyrophosphatase [Candidatus Lokiarchaeota archaeon]MBD3340700.1 sodium-translocating pyrophosphatase [Candidatus Lokiarchaeota archaeon]